MRLPGSSFLTAVMVVLWMLITSKAPLHAQSLKPIKVGRMQVAWTSANGLRLIVDGVPVVRKSTLSLSERGGGGMLLDQRSAPTKVEPWTKNADGKPTARITLENADAVCIYRLTAWHQGDKSGSYTFPRDTLVVDLTYRLKRDVPAEIEYAAAYLSGTVLGSRNCRVSAELPDRRVFEMPIGGNISPTSPPDGQKHEQKRLGSPFRYFHFHTRLGSDEGGGSFAVDYEGSAPLPNIFDARSDGTTWAKEFPVFWVGIGFPAVPVGYADGERHATFIFSSSNLDTSDVGRYRTRPALARVTWISTPDAYEPGTTSKISMPKQSGRLTGKPHFRSGLIAEWDHGNQSIKYLLEQKADKEQLKYPRDVTRLLDGVAYRFGRDIWHMTCRLEGSGEGEVTLVTARDHRPTELSLLLTATLRSDPGRRIGTIIVREAGGKRQEIPLIYGKNIAATDDAVALPKATVAWRDQTDSGQPFLLRSVRVKASPGQRIRSVTVRAGAPESAPALVALTGID